MGPPAEKFPLEGQQELTGVEQIGGWAQQLCVLKHVLSYSGTIEMESGAPEWVSIVRGQLEKEVLTTRRGVDNTASKCKDVLLPPRNFVSI